VAALGRAHNQQHGPAGTSSTTPAQSPDGPSLSASHSRATDDWSRVSPPPPLAARIALLCWLAMAGVLAFDDRPGFKAVAEWVAPVRRMLGWSQSWSMFAPNPPSGTYWLAAQGRRGARWEPLEIPGGRPDVHRWKLRYSRTSKLHRGLSTAHGNQDRRHLAHWLCAQDPTLKRVRFLHVRLPSSPPGTAPATGPVKRTPKSEHKCPGH